MDNAQWDRHSVLGGAMGAVGALATGGLAAPAQAADRMVGLDAMSLKNYHQVMAKVLARTPRIAVPSYRFGLVMRNGMGASGGSGTTKLEGTMRQFSFPAGTIPTTCFAVRVEECSLAQFAMPQIQAELDTLYSKFDSAITDNGFAIEHRESLTLDPPGLRSSVPLRVLAWDSRAQTGVRATWTLMPSQIGYLLFACLGAEPAHQREVIQRYLRIGSVMTSGGEAGGRK